MILFIQQQAPHGSVIGQEGLDACLMGSAFTECALLFLNEGILQIKGQQDPEQLGLKNYSRTYAALTDYGVEKLYCRTTDLNRFGLSVDDLCIKVEAISDDAVTNLVAEANQVLTF